MIVDKGRVHCDIKHFNVLLLNTESNIITTWLAMILCYKTKYDKQLAFVLFMRHFEWCRTLSVSLYGKHRGKHNQTFSLAVCQSIDKSFVSLYVKRRSILFSICLKQALSYKFYNFRNIIEALVTGRYCIRNFENGCSGLCWRV